MVEEKEEVKEEVKVEKKSEEVYKVVDVTTQTAPAIQTPTGDLISEGQGIAMLLNEMAEIKKLIG